MLRSDMGQWKLDDIAWSEFDVSKVRPDLVSVVKAASMVEYNGHDYARYLCEVFAGDAEFQEVATLWAQEEVQHGMALRKWAELADPQFNFEKSFKLFTDGYKLPVNVKESVRGSRCGELIARCVVETGTSSYYTAIKEGTDEPVLKSICAHIAADELRHYKLFYTQLKRYLVKDNIGVMKRLSIALSRIAESEDDELVYAFFAAHNADSQRPYNHRLYRNRYLACAYAFYRKWHIERMTAMVFKAVGLKPYNFFHRFIDSVVWTSMRLRARFLSSYKDQVMAGQAA